MFYLLKVIFMLFVLSWKASCEDTNNIKLLLRTYEENLNTSIILEKNDKLLIKSWIVDFQVKRVNVTTKYRMQMSKHKEHSFRNYSNAKVSNSIVSKSTICMTSYKNCEGNEKLENGKWTACINVHKKEVKKTERSYYGNESNCLQSTTDEDIDEKRTVEQVGKEIRNWRKGYRYLVNLCKVENPDNEESADTCLVEYMQKDNYNKVIERLILMKLDAISELYLKMAKSLNHLEECLEVNLSVYLESVRNVMESLNKCYSLTT